MTDTSQSNPEPGLTLGEYLERFAIVGFAIIVGFIAALIIAFSAGWIRIEC